MDMREQNQLEVLAAVKEIVLDEDNCLMSVLTPQMRDKLDQWGLTPLLDDCVNYASSDRDALARLLAQVSATAETEALA